MMSVAIDVKRERQLLEKRLLRSPRTVDFDPANASVVGHPLAQGRFSWSERHPPSGRSHSTKDGSEFVPQEAPESEPQGRSFGGPAVVESEPRPERLGAGDGRRGDSDVEERCPVAREAIVDGDARRDCAEEPGVNTGTIRRQHRLRVKLVTTVERGL